MTRILIADDHHLVRAGYRQFLQSEPNLDIEEASNGEEALDCLAQRAVDLVLLDMQMPRRGGLDILSEIRSRFPAVCVLMISGLPASLYARLAIRTGASGYLAKNSSPLELLKAVHTLLRGRRYISTELSELLAKDLGKDMKKAPHTRLSPRELEILYQIAGGTRISAIARSLELSVKTVSTYRRRLLDKMSLRSNADITAYVFRNNLVKPSLIPEMPAA